MLSLPAACTASFQEHSFRKQLSKCHDIAGGRNEGRADFLQWQTSHVFRSVSALPAPLSLSWFCRLGHVCCMNRRCAFVGDHAPCPRSICQPWQTIYRRSETSLGAYLSQPMMVVSTGCLFVGTVSLNSSHKTC